MDRNKELKVHRLRLPGRSLCSIRSNRKWCKRRGSSLQCQNCFFVYPIIDCNLKNFKISNQFETQSLFHIENVALFALQNNLRFLDGLLLSSILINLVLRPTLPILFQMYSIHLLQANIYNSVYQKTVHIRLCVGSLPTAQPYLNIASFPTYYNAYHSDLLDMFSCTNPPQIPILMFLLYHNDTIIKKEKELLRALLSQFCKLESVIYHPNY